MKVEIKIDGVSFNGSALLNKAAMLLDALSAMQGDPEDDKPKADGQAPDKPVKKEGEAPDGH